MRRPLLWLRVAATFLVAALALAAIFQPGDQMIPMPGIIALHTVYAALFLLVTRSFPSRRPWYRYVIVVLILIGFITSGPIEDTGLAVITTASIPLGLPRRRWLGWALVNSIGSVAVTFFFMVRSVIQHRAEIPAKMTNTDIAAIFASGLAVIFAWHVFAFLAATLIVHFDTERHKMARLNAELRGTQALLLESGRLAERLRIARELHDAMGHHLTSLNLQLQIANRLPEAELKPNLEKAHFLSTLLLADVREAVSEWRTETSTSLPDALRSLFTAVEGIHVDLQLPPQLPPTDPGTSHALFRCAQEALTNTLRHAGQVDTIQVVLQTPPQSIELDYRDDGEGCLNIQPGNGLQGLTSRVTELGGHVDLHSAPGQGFRMHIRIPLPELAL